MASTAPVSSSTTNYVEASAEIDHAVPPSSTGERQGHLFFGGICDMRTASMTLTVINLIAKMLRITILQQPQQNPIAYDVSMLLSCLGFYGAYHYQYLATGVSTLGFVAVFVSHIIAMLEPAPAVEFIDWCGIVLDTLLIYALAGLTLEIRSGIMTKDSFAREEYLQPQIKETVSMISI